MVVFVLLNILTLCSLFDQVSDMCEKTYSRKFVGPRKRQYNNANQAELESTVFIGIAWACKDCNAATAPRQPFQSAYWRALGRRTINIE
jgi:hypothetical protein